MDVTTLRCGAGGEPAAPTSSTESEALRAIADAVDANIGDFVREMVEAGCDAVACGTLDDRDGEIEALTAIITAAMADLTKHGKGPAQWVLRLVAKQSGIVDALHKAEMGFVKATGERCGRIGVAAGEHPDVLSRLMRRETGLDQIGRALDEIHVALGRERPERIDFAEFARSEAAALTQEVA